MLDEQERDAALRVTDRRPYRQLWAMLALIVAGSLSVLGLLGVRINAEKPPIPGGSSLGGGASPPGEDQGVYSGEVRPKVQPDPPCWGSRLMAAATDEATIRPGTNKHPGTCVQLMKVLPQDPVLVPAQHGERRYDLPACRRGQKWRMRVLLAGRERSVRAPARSTKPLPPGSLATGAGRHFPLVIASPPSRQSARESFAWSRSAHDATTWRSGHMAARASPSS